MHAEREAQRLERLAAKNAEAALFVDQREHTRNATRKDWAETKRGTEVTAASKVTERATRRLDQQEQATMVSWGEVGWGGLGPTTSPSPPTSLPPTTTGRPRASEEPREYR